jgi:hypothetical protein
VRKFDDAEEKEEEKLKKAFRAFDDGWFSTGFNWFSGFLLVIQTFLLLFYKQFFFA